MELGSLFLIFPFISKIIILFNIILGLDIVKDLIKYIKIVNLDMFLILIIYNNNMECICGFQITHILILIILNLN